MTVEDLVYYPDLSSQVVLREDSGDDRVVTVPGLTAGEKSS